MNEELGATIPSDAINYETMPQTHDDIIIPSYKNTHTEPLLFNR